MRLRGFATTFLALTAGLVTSLALAAPIDVNQATEAELDGIKGLGPASTRLILAERAKGKFANWADFVARIKGMGSGRAARLSAAGLTVGGQPFPQAAAGSR